MLSADVYKTVSDSIILLLLSHAPWGRCVPLLHEMQGLSARRLLFLQLLSPLSPFFDFHSIRGVLCRILLSPDFRLPVRVLPPQPPVWPAGLPAERLFPILCPAAQFSSVCGLPFTARRRGRLLPSAPPTPPASSPCLAQADTYLCEIKVLILKLCFHAYLSSKPQAP